ncbi:MAG: hypothetical protein K8F92_03485 [Hyphomicrobium sp.]|uniref:hypothetical protein n=1 Tax=Hyphomicrobium sp. TaxID=82 RepID=UPI0013292235|nr:hypothetical protein [Hyphomicrobium sp.]KAB2939823.1 MAG: hypothetical protein F9K20_15235 [Hyphomicrobium sp.]MBZ0208704.1 hypothetical protein [Hyphomicrobium sp.]
MVARIIELAVYRAQRSLAQEDVAERMTRANESTRFHFWTGASGKRYVHSVYQLLECPPLPAANYVLVRRRTNGRAEALSVGRVNNDAPSLNLAEIRQRGAELAADEIHVHLLADNAKLGKLIEFDLRTGQFEADVARLAGTRPH